MTPEQQALKIRAEQRKHLNAIARRLAAVREQDDPMFPEAHQATRRQERSDLIRQWTHVESEYHGHMQNLRQVALLEAQRLRSQDPVSTPQQESRRVSEQLEIAGLVQQFSGQGRTAVRNSLHEEARKHLILGLHDRARVYIEASKRLGFEDGRLTQDYEAALDASIPARKQARELETVAQDQADLLDNDRYALRIVHNVGDQVRANTGAKLLAWRRGEAMPVGDMGPAWAEGQLHAAAKASGTTE